MPTATCDIGLIGLAVMGQNLVLNMNDHGYRVAVFNRTVSKVDEFINNEAKSTPIVGAHSIEELTAALKTPRRVMLMVKAGETVVVEGQLALANGMKINRKEYPSGTSPAKAGGALTERESSPKDPVSKQESTAAKSAL